MSSETQVGKGDGAEVDHQGHGEEEVLLTVSISSVMLSVSYSILICKAHLTYLYSN